MKAAGIIAEYNPFHKGHAYHLEQTMRLTGAESAVAVISGNFVQRGVPAAVDKYRRTRMALEAGVDLVLELPVYYATGSAERFAYGAVSILNSLGVISDIVCGCECDAAEFEFLHKAAQILVSEPDSYRAQLQDALRQGLSFPAARQIALEAELPGAGQLLRTPNNILAAEYEKALLRLYSDMKLRGISRNDSGYHATGTSLRAAMHTGSKDVLMQELPETSLSRLDYYMEADDLSGLLAYRLLSASPEEMAGCEDMTDAIVSRIMKSRRSYSSFSEFTDMIATRSITEAHVRRALLHLLLDIPEAAPPIDYVRVLGFRRSSPVLHEIKEASSVPLITKLTALPAGTYAAEERAADIYNRLVYDKTGLKLPDEYHAGPIII